MNKSILLVHVGGIKDWRPSNEKAGPTYVALSAVITATCRFCCRLLLSILLVEYIWSKESIMVKICSIALSFALVGTAFSFTLQQAQYVRYVAEANTYSKRDTGWERRDCSIMTNFCGANANKEFDAHGWSDAHLFFPFMTVSKMCPWVWQSRKVGSESWHSRYVDNILGWQLKLFRIYFEF